MWLRLRERGGIPESLSGPDSWGFGAADAAGIREGIDAGLL